GMSIALACDFRFAADSAVFRMPGTSYGLVVSATLLASAVGPAAAKDLLFTARTFQAREARDLNLVSRVVPAAELEPLALDYAQMIAANSPQAVRYAKRVVNLATVLQVALDEEQQVNQLLRGGDDHTNRFNAAADRVLKRG
ncbi:MAG: enoyl-CoA hydratase/isomerase family protein, partial [Dehalococcoidia bacterium]